MRLPIFIISIPISLMFLIFGYLFLTNKLDCKNYGIEFFFFAEQSSTSRNEQKKKNRVGGIVFIICSIILILFPLFFVN